MNRFVLLLLGMAVWYNSNAQSFGEMGSKWTYSLLHRYQTTPNVISTEKDTLFQGKNCHILKLGIKGCEYWGFDTTRNSGSRRRGLIVYESDSVVYFWEWNLKKFEILYDFGAQRDSFWITHYFDTYDNRNRQDWVVYNQVDSTGSIMINGSHLKTLYVTSYFDSISPKSASNKSKIIDRIGDVDFLTMNMRFGYGMCDFDATFGLRCFESPSLGHYATGIVPTCDYTNVGIEEEKEKVELTVYPNPVTDILHLELEETNPSLGFKLFDVNGQVVLAESITESSSQIDLSGQPRGMYFYAIVEEGHRIMQGKIVKQ